VLLSGCTQDKADPVPVDAVVAARLEADFVGRCDTLRMAGAPTDASDLSAWCPVPPEGQNAAKFYESAFRIENPYHKLLALLQASGVESHRYPVDWTDSDRTLMVPYDFTEGVLDAGHFLSLAAHHAVLDDDPIQAMQALLAAFGLVRHTAEDPFLINQTSRNACQRSATLSLVYTLTHLELAEGQLGELQQAVQGAYRPDALPRAWFVEKALAKGRDPFGRQAGRWHYDDARGLAQLRIAWTALALERYHRLHGNVPSQLDALVPDLLDSVPMDPFTGKPLRYAQDGAGFVVFSLGGMGTQPPPDTPLDSYDATQQTAVYVPLVKRTPETPPTAVPSALPAPRASRAGTDYPPA
jgi:hypothetical protein